MANNAVITAGETSAFTGITSQLPTVSINGGGGTICNGSPVALTTTVTGEPAFAYVWTPTAGLSSSTVANPTASPATSTTYSVTVYDANGISATANAALITVIPSPTGVISGTTAICTGQSTSLTITVTGTGPWNGTLSNGAAFSGSTSPIILNVSPASTITYTIATLLDANCTALAADKTGSALITVNSLPAITGQPLSATKCAGESQIFSVTATGTSLTYQWRKGGVNISGATSSSYSIATATTGDAGSYDVVVSGTCAPSVTSSSVTLTINTLPAITGQPISATLCSGQSQTFNVTATGTALTYQWRKAGANISGATSSSYNIASVSTGDAATYDVVVSGTCLPSVTSETVSLSVNTTPTITAHPESQTVCSGTAINLSVSTSSNTGTTYQWKKNGIDINGATLSSYSISSPTSSDGGNYTVAITSCGTTVISNVAILSVGDGGNWLGVTTDWNDPQNWCGGVIPGSTTDVYRTSYKFKSLSCCFNDR